jgi:type IV pilus assembly protein PilM
MFESRYNSLAGLDIGSTSVKVVQLSGVAKLPRLERVAVVSIDPDVDPGAATIKAIKQAVREAKLTTDKAAASVAGPLLAVRHLQFPKLSGEELKGAIHWEGSQVIPFNIEDVYIDFQILPSGGDAAAEKIEVLFIAASKQLIDDRFKLTQRGGLDPRVIDIDALAMLNCFQKGRDKQGDQIHTDTPTTALLNIGARFTNLAVINSNSRPFTRDLMIAGNNFTEAIEKATGVSFKEADDLKKQPNSISLAENTAIMESVFGKLGNEIRLSFDYFQTKEGGNKIDRILLGGGASQTLGLRGFISEALDIPADEWNPLENVEIDPKKFDNRKLMEITSRLTIATGLALRKDPQ